MQHIKELIREKKIDLFKSEPAGWINLIPVERQEEAEMYHHSFLDAVAEAERFWYDIERHRVRENISQWKKENPELSTECRLRYVQNQLNVSLRRLNKLKIDIYSGGEVNKEDFTITKNKVRGLQHAIDVLEGRKVGITDEMIQSAREYPIEKVVEVNQTGFSLCVNHEDRNPSMFCKKNFAHCFSCGWSGDVISVYQKKNNASFKEAIMTLNV